MNLKISEGLISSQIQDLIYYSHNDELIKRTTTDKERFRDEETVNTWLKNRKIYTLVDTSSKLFGIIWFGEKEMPDTDYPKEFNPKQYEITFGIRIYEGARGKGFSNKLFEEGYSLFKQTEDYKNVENKKIWLSTNIDNQIAISLYKKLGFEEVLRDLMKNKLIMVRSLS